MKRAIFLTLAAIQLAATPAAFCGKSAVLAPSQWLAINNMPRTDWPANASWRIEFQIHNWTLPSPYSAYIFYLGNGGVGYVLPQGGVQMYSADNTNGRACNIALAGSNMLVRFQKIAGSPQLTCEAWNYDGTGYQSDTVPIVNLLSPATSGGSLGAILAADLGFFRIFTTTVSLGSRPPTTADHGDYMELPLDGTLNDITGHGHNASNGGINPVAFTPTPNQLAFSFPKAFGSPFWTSSTALRAGNNNKLDGTGSYSLADSTSAVSYFWTQQSGPTLTSFDNRTLSQPTVLGSNLVFGDYTYLLTVTDVNGSSSTAPLETGSVATDDNGIVVQPNPAVDALFGPMIAFGKNPWGYQDYWAQHASNLRGVDYATPITSYGITYPGWSTLGKPQWEFFGQGTVDYYFNCVGPASYCNSANISLAGAVTPASASITVNNSSVLNLTAFPTRVYIYDGVHRDELRVCSVSGNTLNLCYDPAALSRNSFASGSGVYQSKVTGTGTLFISDPNAAVCPLGPGLPGLSSYSTGTVQLAAGSTAMTGAGTAWGVPAVQAGEFVQVSATHSGTPFTFIAQIASVDSTTGITLARPFPADADSASGLTYHVMPATRTLDMQAPSTDPTGVRQMLWGTDGCESETDMYTSPVSYGLGNSFATGHDTALNGQHISGQKYSVTDTQGWVSNSSTGGINFYGEDLAHWALYFRSGLKQPEVFAHAISDYWVRSPFALAGFNTLEIGGGGLGAFLSVITGQNSSVNWQDDLRSLAAVGAQEVGFYVNYGCNQADDSRNSGYAYAFLILASIYDPDTTSTAAPGGMSWRAYWQSFLPQMKANDTACQNQTGEPSQAYSFASGFFFNATAGTPLTVTNGSAAATGTAIPTTFCQGAVQGTATVTNGSNIMTLLSGTPGAGSDSTAIMITGTSGGNPFVQSIEYSGPVGSTVTLGEYWLGDSGTVSWMSSPNIGTAPMMTIAANNNDLVNLQKNWACIYNSPTSITLNRPWDGASGSYIGFNGNGLPLAGYGQQPFTLGIKTYGLNLLASQTVPALSSYVTPYKTFAGGAASWIWNTGMDQQLFTTSYGRIFQQVGPTNTAPPGTSMAYRSPASTYGNEPGGLPAAREQNSETGAAHGIYYTNNPTPANKLLGDEYYGAVWGSPVYTTGGVYSDPYSSAGFANDSNLLDQYIHEGKWTGFFTGVGMSHRWPAIRQGGVQPASPRTINVGICFYDASTCTGTPVGATQATVSLTLPNGTTSVNTCTSGTSCAVTGDGRMGSQYTVLIQYKNAGGSVLQQATMPVTAP